MQCGGEYAELCSRKDLLSLDLSSSPFSSAHATQGSIELAVPASTPPHKMHAVLVWVDYELPGACIICLRVCVCTMCFYNGEMFPAVCDGFGLLPQGDGAMKGLCARCVCGVCLCCVCVVCACVCVVRCVCLRCLCGTKPGDWK